LSNSTAKKNIETHLITDINLLNNASPRLLHPTGFLCQIFPRRGCSPDHHHIRTTEKLLMTNSIKTID